MPPTATSSDENVVSEVMAGLPAHSDNSNVVLCNYEFYESTEKWLLGTKTQVYSKLKKLLF